MRRELAETPDGAASDSDALLYREGKKVLGPKSGGLITDLKTAFGVEGARELIAVASGKADAKEYVNGALRRHLQTDAKFAELVEITKDAAPIEAPGDARRFFERALRTGGKAAERDRIADEIIAGATRAVAEGWPVERGRALDLRWWLNGERWKASRPAAGDRTRSMDFGDDPNAY